MQLQRPPVEPQVELFQKPSTAAAVQDPPVDQGQAAGKMQGVDGINMEEDEPSHPAPGHKSGLQRTSTHGRLSKTTLVSSRSRLSSSDLAHMPLKKLEAESAALQARQQGPMVISTTAVPNNASVCMSQFDCASCQKAASGSGGNHCLWCHHSKGTTTAAHFYCSTTCNTGDANAGCSADDIMATAIFLVVVVLGLPCACGLLFWLCKKAYPDMDGIDLTEGDAQYAAAYTESGVNYTQVTEV